MDYSRNNWPFNHYSDICYSGNGVGCDDCYCPCHGQSAPEFLTMEDVIEWHVPSYLNEVSNGVS